MSGTKSATPIAAPSPISQVTDDRFDGMTPTLQNLLTEVFRARATGILPHIIRALKFEGIGLANEFIDINCDWTRSPFLYEDPARLGTLSLVPPHVITKMALLLVWARQRRHDMQRDLVETDWDYMDAAQ